MTLRQPHEDAVLPAADAAMIRQVLGACADLIAWAERHCGRDRRGGRRRGRGRRLQPRPGALAGQASLAIDYLDLANAVGSDW